MAETHLSSARNRVVQRRSARKDGFTRAKRQVFLDTLAATCNVTLAAKAAGFPAGTCYKWRRNDAEFAALWQEALTIGYERLESALLDYTLERVERQEIDPDAASPDAIEGSVVQALKDRTISIAELQFALKLLNRHEAGATGRAYSPKTATRATAAETDAALKKKLDTIARQMARHDD